MKNISKGLIFYRLCSIFLAQMIIPIIAMHRCTHDSDCMYSEFGEMNRCCSLGLCTSSGSCTDRTEIYGSRPSNLEYAASISEMSELLQGPSLDSFTTLPSSANNSMAMMQQAIKSPSPSDFLSQILAQLPLFASSAQEPPSSSDPDVKWTISLAGCNAVCNPPTVCTTCSGTAANTIEFTPQLYFCCDTSNGLNIQMCKVRVGCPSTSSKASTHSVLAAGLILLACILLMASTL